MAQSTNQMTLAMKAIIRNDLEAFTHLYKGKEDIQYSFTDNSGYHSIISLICQYDSQKNLKIFLYKYLMKQLLLILLSNPHMTMKLLKKEFATGFVLIWIWISLN